MSLQDDLKAKTLTLISQQMANWVVDIQRQIGEHQGNLVRALDELQENVARYDEKEAHGATVVEVYAVFEAASEHGLVGRSLLLEHVHPNLDGYFLLADAFYDSMIAQGLPGAPTAELSEADARAWIR